MKKLPVILIYSRLVLGIGMLLLSAAHVNHFPELATIILTFGLLSDIFDGILARKIGVSTEGLRRLDSSIDQVFFLSAAAAIYLHCPSFFQINFSKITVLIVFEALAYLICFLKFRKEIATHTIGAKIWTLVLFSTLVEITLQGRSDVLFSICFWLGLFTRLEIIAIILVLKQWTNDVPSIYHSIQLRQGKDIKRNDLFNG